MISVFDISLVMVWFNRNKTRAWTTIITQHAERYLEIVDFSRHNLLPKKKIRRTAKIRKRYNQVPDLTQDTTWESNRNTINIKVLKFEFLKPRTLEIFSTHPCVHFLFCRFLLMKMMTFPTITPDLPRVPKYVWSPYGCITPCHHSGSTQKEANTGNKTQKTGEIANPAILKRLIDGFFDPWDLSVHGGSAVFIDHPVYEALKCKCCTVLLQRFS